MRSNRSSRHRIHRGEWWRGWCAFEETTEEAHLTANPCQSCNEPHTAHHLKECCQHRHSSCTSFAASPHPQSGSGNGGDDGAKYRHNDHVHKQVAQKCDHQHGDEVDVSVIKNHPIAHSSARRIMLAVVPLAPSGATSGAPVAASASSRAWLARLLSPAHVEFTNGDQPGVASRHGVKRWPSKK
jgi:hypothetical protein